MVWTEGGKLTKYLRDNEHNAAFLQTFGASNPAPPALALPKNSPLTPMFRQGFLRLRENGMLDRARCGCWRMVHHSSRLTLKSRLVIGMGQVALIFYLIVGIIGIVFLVLGLEVLWHKLDWHEWIIGRSLTPVHTFDVKPISNDDGEYGMKSNQ